MKYLKLLVIVLGIPTTVMAQFLPGKEMAFAQIVFGGGYETVLNVTNRGPAEYNLTLTLRPTDPRRPFPALVNGSAVPASGQVTFRLNPGAASTLTITSGDPAAGTLSGFAIVKGNDPYLANLLDGNLTYYLKSADGTILDSVGVAPSRLVVQSVIPFDDFQTVALALANIHPSNDSIIRLTLFDENNVRVGGAQHTLGPNQHLPRFLSELVPGIRLTKGRVEILATVPVLGTALTFVRGGQASSLPFLMSPRLYELRLSLAGQSFTGHMYLFLDPPYVTGYFFEVENGVPRPESDEPFSALVNDNGDLESLERESSDSISRVSVPRFNALAPTQTGTFTIYSLTPGVAPLQGTITLTAIR